MSAITLRTPHSSTEKEPTMSHTTAVITTAAARLTEAGYHVTTRQVPRLGSDATEPMVWACNGSKLATLSGNSDGGVFVSMMIDYGQHGSTFCDGVDLKSASGIVKRVARFLGEPKAVES